MIHRFKNVASFASSKTRKLLVDDTVNMHKKTTIAVPTTTKRPKANVSVPVLVVDTINMLKKTNITTTTPTTTTPTTTTTSASSSTTSASSAKCDGTGYLNFQRLSQKWMKRLPMIQPQWDIDQTLVPPHLNHYTKMSWLVERTSPWGLGCMACVKASEDSTCSGGASARNFSKYNVMSIDTVNIGNLLKHHNHSFHKANVFRLLEIPLGPTLLPTSGSPPESHFKQDRIFYIIAHTHSARPCCRDVCAMSGGQG